MKRPLKITLIIIAGIALLGILSVVFINLRVKAVARKKIITSQEALELKDVDCILVLGCKVKDNGEPSPMLLDRLITGTELYKEGAAPKILMSGDHGRDTYDEVNVMKKYALDNGIPSEDVFMDHAGFSTYDSIYRAKHIFEAKKVIIVTQEYHLNRALYLAHKLGLEAYGVPADLRDYSGQTMRDIREIVARCKDFALGAFKPKPTYLGDVIPISGDGNATND